MRIDAHHHLWKYSAKEYSWIGDDMAVLRRDFLPHDLGTLAAASSIDGTVAVQARQTLEETSWLLEMAQTYHIIRGVVGWVPLQDPRIEEILERSAGERKLVGVRHVLQDEPANLLMEDARFNAGVRMLGRYGLVYDILIHERHLAQAIEFVDRHPNQRFVLDHLAKPRASTREMEPWRGRLSELARRENVYCKLSGLATEAQWDQWNVDELAPYIQTAVEAFSPRRLMFGSDWPVALVATSYPRWVRTVEALIARLTAEEQERIWAGTAGEAYGLAW